VEAADNSVYPPEVGSGVNNFTNPWMGAAYHYYYTFTCPEYQGLLYAFKLTCRENSL